jgi:GT2 family glycosyltransferase
MIAMRPLPIVVAIPVKNEEERIGACLASLAAQTRKFDRLVLLLNNCNDGTLQICNEFQARHAGVEIYEEHLHGPLASAGEARRLAFQYACTPFADSILLTTDADAVPERSWIEKNSAAIAAGAHAVCGAIEMDPRDAPCIAHLAQDDAREKSLLELLDEIACLLNPDSFDPWPRHQQQSGASIALRSDVLRLAGGPPQVAACEDRILIEKLRLVDARIRHAPGIRVQVSGRIEGRAAGGMAETLARRLHQQDALTDDKLEPAIDALRRATAQARLFSVRQGNEDAAALAGDLLISPAEMHRILRLSFHGQAWAEMQRISPVLHRRRVAFADLEREIRIATGLRDRLLDDAKRPTRGFADFMPDV